jgi:hypothetical protein
MKPKIKPEEVRWFAKLHELFVVWDKGQRREVKVTLDGKPHALITVYQDPAWCELKERKNSPHFIIRRGDQRLLGVQLKG